MTACRGSPRVSRAQPPFGEDAPCQSIMGRRTRFLPGFGVRSLLHKTNYAFARLRLVQIDG